MRILFFTLIAFTLMGTSKCSNVPHLVKADTVKAVQINYSIPILLDSGQIAYMNDSMVICYYKDLVLLKMPYARDNFMMKLDDNGDATQHLINREIKTKCFIYDKKQLYGYKYDSLSAVEGKRTAVEPFLKERITWQVYQLCENVIQSASLLQNKKLSTNIFLEAYKYPNKSDDISYADSVLLYYSNDVNLKASGFSFSKKVDSIKAMKLFKMRFIYNVNKQTEDPYGKAAKELSLNMKIIPVENKEEITTFFEQFIKKEKKEPAL